MFDYVLSRLKEPSTWAGIGVVVSLFLGHEVDAGVWGAVVTAGIALAGVAAVFVPEFTPPVEPPLPPAA